MNPNKRPSTGRSNDSEPGRCRRRRFLALGIAVAATTLAGCSAGTDPGDADGGGSPSDGSSGSSGEAGTFRLLISDRPADIGDFDSLEVSFEEARIVGAGDVESGPGTETSTGSPTETVATTDTVATVDGPSTTDSSSATDTSDATDTPDATATPTAPSTATEAEEGDERVDGDGGRGFLTLDLGGATVDLTQVVGEKAIGILEEEVPEGRYAKIELYAAGVEGIVDGDPVDVKIPSGKLQIVKPFEVEAGKSVSFVFDINVVRKGKAAKYNLLPVIAESGVAGRDVEVEEVGRDGERRESRTDDGGNEASTGGSAGAEREGDDPDESKREGPPDDGGAGSDG